MVEAYDIYSLGYSKNLVKEDDFYNVQGTMPDKTEDGIDPSQLNSGEWTGNQTMVDGFFQSANYVAGVSGWKILPNGNVEFGSGYFRGDITGATGTFTGTLTGGSLNIPDTTSANSFHTDASGNSFWGCTPANFVSDINNAKAYILNTGVAKFADIFEVGAGGKLLTWDNSDLTLLGGIITGGTLQTATSGQRVVIAGATNSIILYKTGTDASFTLGSDFGNLVFLSKVFSTETGKSAGTLENQGTGAAAVFNITNAANDYSVIYLSQAGSGCHIRMNDLSADPTMNGGDAVGDMAVVNGNLKLCTTAGSPGTYSVVGGAFDGRYNTDSGNYSGYAVTIPYDITSYTTGMSVRFKAATANTAEIMVTDCETVWDNPVGNSTATASSNALYVKNGTYGALIGVIASTADSGTLIASDAITSVNLSTKNYVSFWIKAVGSNISAGTLQLLLDDTANCASPKETFNIPALINGVWKHCTFPLANRATDTAIISIGLWCVTGLAFDYNIAIDYVYCGTYLDVNGVEPIEIKMADNYLKGGDIVAGDYIDAIYDGEFWQMEKNYQGKVTVASDNLKTSADAEKDITDTGYTKYKEIISGYNGVMRIKFDIKDTNGNTAYGRIYINGVAKGTEQSTTSTSYVTKSEDITVGSGERIQFYGKAASSDGKVSNLRFYYDLNNTNDQDVVVTN